MAWDAMGLAFLPLYYVSAHLSIITVSFSMISSLPLQCFTLSLSFPLSFAFIHPFSLLVRIPEEEAAWLTTDVAAPYVRLLVKRPLQRQEDLCFLPYPRPWRRP